MDWDEEFDEEVDCETNQAIRKAPACSFGFTMSEILKPTRRDQTKIKWLTTNPGSQLMTGSFHPLPAEGWAAEVHLPPGSHGFHRIVLTGGHVIERESRWGGNEERRRMLQASRKRFIRALLVAFPELNDSLRYSSTFLNPSSTVAQWRDETYEYDHRRDVNWGERWLVENLVLRSAASSLDCTQLQGGSRAAPAR